MHLRFPRHEVQEQVQRTPKPTLTRLFFAKFWLEQVQRTKTRYIAPQKSTTPNRLIEDWFPTNGGRFRRHWIPAKMDGDDN